MSISEKGLFVCRHGGSAVFGSGSVDFLGDQTQLPLPHGSHRAGCSGWTELRPMRWRLGLLAGVEAGRDGDEEGLIGIGAGKLETDAFCIAHDDGANL